MIELVVVTTIISVLALTLIVGSGADTLFGRGGGTAADRAARGFEQAVETARERAFLTQLPHGILPLPEGWLLLERDREADGWRIAERAETTATGWTIDNRAHFPAPLSTDAAPEPRVVLAADGRITPFSADFHAGQHRVRCQSDGWEAVQCAAP
ncbi:MAG: Type II transport protein GspH [Rhodobacteraceae bacterium HLUCCA12]|nr:MAG: Type II transport protein GspH [Rhodobacteraceae bacterium HLUCCA12]